MLPRLAARTCFANTEARGRVRAIFLYVPDEGQIGSTYRTRERADQVRRAHIGWQYSEWLRAECVHWGIPTVSARPWDTVLRRAIAAVAGSPLPALPS